MTSSNKKIKKISFNKLLEENEEKNNNNNEDEEKENNIRHSANKIKEDIITNLLSMLIYRGEINENKQEELKKLILNDLNDKYKYIITDKNNKEIIIKFINEEINSVSKDSTIIKFIKEYEDKHNIIIVKKISQKNKDILTLQNINTEIFLEESLKFNLTQAFLVPSFSLINDREEIEKIKREYNITNEQFPKQVLSDPVSCYLNAKVGDIVRYIQPNINSVCNVYFLIVVKNP